MGAHGHRSSPPRCQRGHPMRVEARFRFDDEATDTPDITAQIAGLRRDFPTLEFDADVTLYYCAVCDFAEARFDYGEDG